MADCGSISGNCAVQARFAAMLLLFHSVSGIKTSCSIITRRESGDLICWFSENIAESQHSFVVHRYNLDYTESTPVVHCTWIAQGLACTSESGYVFNKEVSAIAVIQIPHLTKQVEGKYVCQVVGNVDKDDEVCEYQHTEPPREEHTTTSASPPVTTLDEAGAPHITECKGPVLLAVFGAAGVTVIPATVLMITWLKKRRRGSRTPHAKVYRKSEPEEEQEALDSRVLGSGPIVKEVNSCFTQTEDECLKEIASRFDKRFFQLFEIIDLSVEAALRRHREKRKRTKKLKDAKQLRVSTRNYRPSSPRGLRH